MYFVTFFGKLNCPTTKYQIYQFTERYCSGSLQNTFPMNHIQVQTMTHENTATGLFAKLMKRLNEATLNVQH